MTKQTYTAFGVLRTSENIYTHAAKHYVGVTFHQSEQAARNSGGQVVRTTVLTPDEARAIRKAEKALRDELAAKRGDEVA